MCISRPFRFLSPHHSHCDWGANYIVVGRHALDGTEGEEIAVKEEVPHPDYNATTTNNDFRLIFLSETVAHDVELVTLDSSIQLSNELLVSNSCQLTVMGWGDTTASNDTFVKSNELMKIDVNLITNEACKQSSDGVNSYSEFPNEVTENMMCAKDSGKDSCQGDSGGPLVLKSSQGADIQVGVVSWGLWCADEYFPGVYARVSSAYNWIKNVTCMRSVSPPAYFECDNLEATATTIIVVETIVGVEIPSPSPTESTSHLASESPTTVATTTVTVTTDAPTAGSPATNSPITHSPAGSPITNSPITNSPITGSPITGSPTAGPTTTGSPITGSPIAGSPIAGPPTTSSPMAGSLTTNSKHELSRRGLSHHGLFQHGHSNGGV